MQCFALNGGAQQRQRGHRMALAAKAGVLNDGNRRVGVQAFEELVLNVLRAGNAHVDHQRQPGLRGSGAQQCPVRAGSAWLCVTGDKHHAVGMLPVRERHAQ